MSSKIPSELTKNDTFVEQVQGAFVKVPNIIPVTKSVTLKCHCGKELLVWVPVNGWCKAAGEIAKAHGWVIAKDMEKLAEVVNAVCYEHVPL